MEELETNYLMLPGRAGQKDSDVADATVKYSNLRRFKTIYDRMGDIIEKKFGPKQPLSEFIKPRAQ